MSDRDDEEGSVTPPNEDVKQSKKRKEQPSPDQRKTSKTKRVKGIDDEAEESEDEDEGGSDDDTDEGDGTQYVEDDFLVRDDAESDSGSDDGSGSDDANEEKMKEKEALQRLKRRKHDVRLDEEDELLIQEYEATRVGRHGGREAESKLSNRVAADSHEIAPEALKRPGVVDDDEDEDEELVAPSAKAPAASRGYYEDDEGSDMGGFIVDEDDDDEGEGGSPNRADGEPRRRARAASSGDRPVQNSRRTGRREGPTYDQLQEAMDIFGAGFDDFSDEEELAGARQGESDEEGDDRAGAGAQAGTDLNKQDQRRIQKLRSRYERAQLVATFCTERDDVLRRVDRPERLQQVLVGRDTPDDAERQLEARWMAAKVAARMIAEKHLDPGRRTVPLTANPQAAFNSSLFSYGSDFEKEDQLRAELPASIGHVLRFLQVDQLEVPFIWTYRRDYLHPALTRQYLWLISALEEEWDAKVESKMRLSEDVTAMVDAAGEDADQSEEALSALQRSIQRGAAQLEVLQSELRLAEAEVQAAMDLVDELDEPSAEDRQRVTEASAVVEDLQAREKEAADQLGQMRAQEAELLARHRRRARFHPALARETVRLFPPDRYMAIVKDSVDDQELRDVIAFWRLVSQNSDADENGSGGAAAEESQAETGDTQPEEGPRRLLSKKALRLRKDEYARLKNNAAVREFIEQMCLPVHAFGDALRHGFRPNVPQTPEARVEDYVRTLLPRAPQFRDEQAFLRAVRVVVGTELSREPSVRGFVRDSYKRLATVSTRPTIKGKTVITPFHELFGLHYLDHKPLSDFFQGEDRVHFIRLVEAEREGLITITMDLPTIRRVVDAGTGAGAAQEVEIVDIATFLKEVVLNFMPKQSVHEDLHPQSRQSWDRERLMCLQACVDQQLVPSLQAELRRELVRIGKEVIVQQAADNFSALLATGPYVPPYQDVRERVKDTLRACPNRPFYGTVAAIYISLGRQEPLCMAFVNRDGVLRAHDLVPSQAMNQKDERIKRFLVENRPDLVVINASGAGAARSTAISVERSILKEVEEEVKRRDLARREGRMEGVSYADDDEEFVPYRAQVMVVKDELSRIFMSSQRSKDMFPDLQPGEAAAVCLARFCQEPLAEYCCAWKAANSQEVFGHELLFLKTHPLLDLLRGAKQALLNTLEQRLVDAVCDVGVDINKACAYDHLAPMLAFVGGLGLRKADALRQNIRKGAKTVTLRNDLLVRKLLGTNVWTNAVGFLRICGEATQDPLDNTRIHPECYATYDFATKICADALEVAHSHSDYYGIVEKLMASSRRVLEKRMERHKRWLDLWEGGQRPIPGVTPYDEIARTVDGREVPLDIELNDVLAQLELDDYAAELEASGQGKRRLLLDQIKDELRFPWLDLRLPLIPWTPQEMFFLLTNQTDRSVYVGMKVSGTVVDLSDETVLDERTGDYRRRQRAVVQTEAGIRGFVSMFDAVDRPTDRPFSFETFNLADVLYVGKHIEAVVVGVRKDKLNLDLSIKPSHLEKSEAWWMAQRCEDRQARAWWESIGKDPARLFDRYFQETEALRVCQEEEDAQKQSAAAVHQQLATTSISGPGGDGNGKPVGGARSLMRVVHHPLFANLDFKAAEERMRVEGKGAGEVLVRPSSKGPNYLTITWAFQENWYKHISVEERGKRSGDLGLGPQLYVQEDDLREPYHDLDELFSRYIEPMNDLVSVVVKHRSFRHGTPAEVEALMFAERTDNPTRIPYFFRFEPNKPGAFVLTWLSLNIKSENPVRTMRIEVRPYGLRVQTETFVRPSDLIVWFKESQTSNQARQLQQQAEARRAAAAASRANTLSAANAAAAAAAGAGPYGAYPALPAPLPGMAAAPGAEPVRRSRFHN